MLTHPSSNFTAENSKCSSFFSSTQSENHFSKFCGCTVVAQTALTCSQTCRPPNVAHTGSCNMTNINFLNLSSDYQCINLTKRLKKK